MPYRILFAVGLLLFHAVAGAAFAVTQDELKSEIEARYKVTARDFLGNFEETGSVLVVQKEGIRADRPRAVPNPAVITNRQITAAGGGDVPLGGNLADALKVGDRLYLYGVRTGDDYVELTLFTVKNFIVTGTKGPTPLQASTRFRYGEGLAAVTAQQVIADIDTWFRTEEEVRDKARDAAKTQATRTVRLGQTTDEVTAILGAPDKKILLGAKILFVYRDVTVVFVDGKLADAH